VSRGVAAADAAGAARIEHRRVARPDARPDVEHAESLDAVLQQRVDQPLTGSGRAVLAEIPQLVPGVALAELVGRAAAAGVATRARPARQARTSWRMNRT